MSGNTDNITVLQCAPGLRLAKLIRPGEIVTYDSTRTYNAWTVQIPGLADLEKFLESLTYLRQLCIVRGKLANGERARGIRRLLHDDPLSGDKATLLEVPRRWVALDIEGVPRPSTVQVIDLAACARFAIARLPSSFHRAACIVQATAGHGIKPDLRLRLWYWLSRPTTGGELTRWLKGAPADASIFRAAQIIYTAAPLFEGMVDHLPSRMVTLPGDAEVRVPSPFALAPPARRPLPPLPQQGAPGANQFAKAMLDNAGRRVAAAPIDQRHLTCLSQARSLARLVAAGLLTESEVKNAMGDALERAGKTKEEGEAMAAWAIAHPSTNPLPDGIAR